MTGGLPADPESTGPFGPAATGPARLLVVTSLYPTPDRPQAGPFVARRVAALRDSGVDVVVASSPSYRAGPVRRHLLILKAALTAPGPFHGVEAHPLLVAGLVALAAARLRRIPLVVYAHGSDVVVTAQRTAIHAALARLVARSAAAVVTNSTDTAGFVERLGARPLIIPPGVDLDLFTPSTETREEARLRLGLRSGRLALYVGSLSRLKGADLFAAGVDAAAGWTGLLVGDGELAAELAANHPDVVQRGPVAPDAVASWLRAADVVVVPSRREPLGLAAVEALACGTPVIAAAVGGLRDVIRDGENGLLVPPEDPTAIADALGRLSDPLLRAKLAGAARASVAGHDIREATAAMAAVWADFGVPSPSAATEA